MESLRPASWLSLYMHWNLNCLQIIDCVASLHWVMHAANAVTSDISARRFGYLRLFQRCLALPVKALLRVFCEGAESVDIQLRKGRLCVRGL